MKKSAYEIFIKGETIDLVFPNEKAIDDGWYRWFNDRETTRWLDQGAFPNTREKQQAFLEGVLAEDSDRLALMILPKGATEVIGVVSLSGLNGPHRTAQTAMVIGEPGKSASFMFHGLEAKARITEHAFEVMGLERVWGGQAVDLHDWQRFQLLFGFRPEGIMRKAFRKGHKVSDKVITSCLLEDYLKIKEARKGHYWPGKAALMELMRKVPEESIVERVAKAIQTEVDDYLKNVPLS